MIVEKRRLKDHTLLRVEGVVKLGESAQFFAQNLERTLEREKGHVLVDLSRIDYMDSTGVGELVSYLGRFQGRERKLILVDPSQPIRRVLEVARLDEIFPTYDSLEEALGAERAPRAGR